MLRNLIKIAFRNLRKDKGYSTINILGLTIGITCSLFLLLYILDELSYDRYHKNAENIYRVISDIRETDDAFVWSSTQVPLADELQDNYPEVKNAVRFISIQPTLFKNGEKQFTEGDFYLTDSTVFRMFSYEFVEGDPATALDKPFSIVLTEKTAGKYFDHPAEAVGHSLQNQKGEEYKITGVIKDVPHNSHFRFEGLISRSTDPKQTGSWGSFYVTTYLQLPPGYDLAKMQGSLDKIIKEKVNPIFEKFGIKIKYGMQRMTDIHLYSKIHGEEGSGGDISYIYIFSAVAAFMLIIACINYMNLATARSVNRAKEVGIRKVVGSARRQLILQFVIESVVVTSIALVLSIALIYLLLPAFNTLANKVIGFSYLLQPRVIGSLIGIVLFTGLAAGSYPAFYLSGFSPVSVLKGKVASKGGNALFRRSLVVVQFSLSIFMLICTFIVFDQLQFLRSTDLGFIKEQMIRLEVSGQDQFAKAKVLAEKLRQDPHVVSIGMAQSSPGQGIGKNLLNVEDAEGKMVERGVNLYGADYDYVTTLGMKIVAGRNFSHDNPGDSTHAVLVNESMVKRMGWKDAIGKRFEQGEGPNAFRRQVVGVIKDYHQNSLYNPIEPLMITLDARRNNYVFVHTQKGNAQESLAAIEKAWKEVLPDNTFQYAFLDQDFDSQYKADQKRSQIFTAFSGLTIFIACLGLLGLAAFTTEQRTKEIGVRKVIGASVQSLVILVSREFFLLVSVGMVLAFPAAWFFTNSWLKKFAYRIELSNEWSTFVISTVMAFVITLLTVGYHVIRSASTNPVKSLRTE